MIADRSEEVRKEAMKTKCRHRKHDVLEPNRVNKPSNTPVSHESIFLHHNTIGDVRNDVPIEESSLRRKSSCSCRHVLKHFGIVYQPRKDCESMHD